MSELATKNPGRPLHLWIVGVLSLLWNFMGCYDYIMTQTRNEAYMAKFSQIQLDYFYGLPAWVDGSWALAVWGSLAGSILLLMARKISIWPFLVSFVCMVLTTIYSYGISNGLEVMGDAFSLIFSALIFVIALALVLYTRSMSNRGVLR